MPCSPYQAIPKAIPKLESIYAPGKNTAAARHIVLLMLFLVPGGLIGSNSGNCLGQFFLAFNIALTRNHNALSLW